MYEPSRWRRHISNSQKMKMDKPEADQQAELLFRKRMQMQGRNSSPKSVITPPFSSQPSSASPSMERRMPVSRNHPKEASSGVPMPLLNGASGLEIDLSSDSELPANLSKGNNIHTSPTPFGLSAGDGMLINLFSPASIQIGIVSSKTQGRTENPSTSSIQNGLTARLTNQLNVMEIGQQAVDPISEINLRETSEFVRSFPVVNEKIEADTVHKFQQRREGNVGVKAVPKRSDFPSTPSRNFNGNQSATSLRDGPGTWINSGNDRPWGKYMMRWKPFPSKWDDAEKWLINSSPAHPQSRNGHDSSGGQNINLQVLPKNDQFFNKCNVYESKFNIPDGPGVNAGTITLHNFPEHLMLKSEVSVEERANKIDLLSFPDDHRSDGGGASSTVSSAAFSTEMNLSASFDSSSSQIDFPMKDKFTVVQAQGYGCNCEAQNLAKQASTMKDAATEISPTVSLRDMGTQVTPLGSGHTSRCHTPIKTASPARHNTPARTSALVSNAGVDLTELEKCHFAKLQLQGLSAGSQLADSFDKSTSNWSSREEEEEDISKSLRHFDHFDLGESCKVSVIEARAAAWEEAERSKCLIRYHQEEAKIQAWEDHQKAKAEAQLKKLEVKIEKMRSSMKEKMTNKLVASHRRAEEWRAVAQAQHVEQIARTSERAERMRRDGTYTSSICACFNFNS